MTNLTIERVEADGLRRQAWRFTVDIGYTDKVTIRVHDYRTETRPTTRHKWRTTTDADTNFNSHDNRGYHDGNGLPREKVPLPFDVRSEVLSTIASWCVFDTEGGTNR